MTPRFPTPPQQPPTPAPQAAPEPLAGAGGVVTGIPAFGTLIQVLAEAGPPAVFVNIAGVGDINGPTTAMGEAETTSHSSGARVRTMVPTLVDPGTISFPCFWNPADPTQRIDSPYGMEYLFWNGVITRFRLVNTDATHRTREFDGFVNNISETYPRDGICTRNVTLRVTGPQADVASAISMTPTSASPVKAGGPGTFDVATGGATTPWLAVSSVPWVTITSPTGTTVGDEDVAYTVAANPGTTSRTGHINIPALNLSFAITQAGT